MEKTLDLSPGVTYFLNQAGKLLFAVGSPFSLTSLAVALTVAALFFAWQRRSRGRRIRWRTIARALFPKRILASNSNYADLGYLFFNVFVFGVVFGWAILSYQFLSNAIITGLVTTLGPVEPSAPVWVSRSVITVMLFLSYELGYWFNHWLCHRVPVLWEFHKVHHTAEVLTPLTNFRVHPVYTWIFANIVAASAAIANGLGNYMFGDTAYQYALSDTNIILVLFIHAYVHLQHSHMWIPFRGVWGRIFVSPAHHQVHHSGNPVHFNKNYGSCLALWDWIFGTLHVPAKQREKLVFGFQDHPDAHTIKGELWAPLMRAYERIRAMGPKRAPQIPALPAAERKRI